ncbi:MarR family winged helix-turn-helix transcriptional regulator [Humibacter sp. RRB41]|uniref:MarR family winged helix-turn-helix transcriptional regulator n=1 Tax=Humibacter sp. RRB41 TaxID=2919946 RepID=UPI001FAA0DE9|nr:MarR family transcriptional regulator [Humibacter sp. RRB41]
MVSQSRPARDPGDMLGYLVKHVQRRLSAQADAALEPLGIDRAEFGVLWVLARSEPLSQQGIAANAGVDATTMVALIDALEAKGMLTRRPDPGDRRRNLIELTAAGQATCREAEVAHTAAEEQFLAPLSSTQATQFRRMLRALLESDAAPGPG